MGLIRAYLGNSPVACMHLGPHAVVYLACCVEVVSPSDYVTLISGRAEWQNKSGTLQAWSNTLNERCASTCLKSL